MPPRISRACRALTGVGGAQPSGTSAWAGPASVANPAAAARTAEVRRMVVASGVVTGQRISAPPRSPPAREAWTRSHPPGARARVRNRPRPVVILGRMFVLDTTTKCATGEQVCNQVYDWTQNQGLANASDVFIGKPLALLGLLVLGLVIRWVLHRLVDRVVARAQDG